VHQSTPKFRGLVTFTEVDGKTEVIMRMMFATAEERERTVKTFGAAEGLEQNLDRLVAFTST
jgi:hypothetical protein